MRRMDGAASEPFMPNEFDPSASTLSTCEVAVAVKVPTRADH